MKNEENIQEEPNNLESQSNSIDWGKSTLLVRIQILPTTEDDNQRQVILSAGIKGEVPLLSSCTLRELLTGIPLQEICQKLEQALPQIIAAAKTREKAKNQIIETTANQSNNPPEMPKYPIQKSTQLTLF
ncbi:hypothetical protein IQ264_23285 [Phormidium sp. LEGE 05292]|uniref:hypothetical protein n=1 Tax=[Phormidium] sp. LEGE 05292 TaxID=767427 RepID=UPI0018828856|nr:hypothetical protein [Phormidium sp. LEGE 05292]MBE9228347.1 hypothetical protein [Phormidium sp. LEGE 05292]